MHDHFPQIRAARVLLGWTQERLADAARVALTALKRLESPRGLKVHEGTYDQVRRTLKDAGIQFLSTDQGMGVLLLKNPAQDTKPRK